MMELKKILYPTDFSQHALCAAPYAGELARQFGAQLHCLYVVDDSYQYWLGSGETEMPMMVPMEEIMDSAQEKLEKLANEQFASQGLTLVCKVVTGRPFGEIIRYAQEEQIDLIVIATHGHGALASMLLGGVTEKVVRKSTCPVLTVRDPSHKFEICSEVEKR